MNILLATELAGDYHTMHPVSYMPLIVSGWLIIQGIITLIRGFPISRNPDNYTPESVKKYGRVLGVLLVVGGGLFLFLQLDFHNIFEFSIPLAFALLGVAFLFVIAYAIILVKGLKKK